MKQTRRDASDRGTPSRRQWLVAAGQVGAGALLASCAPAAVPAAPTGGGGEITVIEGGRSVGQTTPENASRDGLTVVDLSDDWLPFVFSEVPGKPQPLRPFLIDLANGRFRGPE